MRLNITFFAYLKVDLIDYINFVEFRRVVLVHYSKGLSGYRKLEWKWCSS